MNIPTYPYDAARAAQAYEAYSAMLRRQNIDPTLRENPAWVSLREQAFAMFEAAFAGKA